MEYAKSSETNTTGQSLIPSMGRRSFLKVISTLFAQSAIGGGAEVLQTLGGGTPAWISTYRTLAPLLDKLSPVFLTAHKAIEAVGAAQNPFDLALRVAGAIRWGQSEQNFAGMPDVKDLTSISGIFTKEDKFKLGEQVHESTLSYSSEKLKLLMADTGFRAIAEKMTQHGDSRLAKMSDSQRVDIQVKRLAERIMGLSNYGPEIADKLPKLLAMPQQFEDSLGWNFMRIFSDPSVVKTILEDPVRQALGDLYIGLRSVYGETLAGALRPMQGSDYAQDLIRDSLRVLESNRMSIPSAVKVRAKAILETNIRLHGSDDPIENLLNERHTSSYPSELLEILYAAHKQKWKGKKEPAGLKVSCEARLGSSVEFTYNLTECTINSQENWRINFRRVHKL